MKIRRLTLAVLIFLAAALASAAGSQQKQVITHEILYSFKRVASPKVSPDGRWVVFSLTEPNYDDKEQVSDLWIVPADGGATARRLTATKGGESDVAWSPDSSRIAFGAKREGDEVPQIYVLNIAGGEAARVTKLSTGARKPQWRPDGRALLFTSDVYPGAMDDEANRRMAKERKERKYSARVYESFPVRNWDRWIEDTRPHPFVQPLDADAAAKDLIAGAKLLSEPGFSGAPGDLGGEEVNPIWSPDGASVVFVASTDENTAAYALTTTQLYRVPATGGEPERITPKDGAYGSPQFRPDGKALYFSWTPVNRHSYNGERIGMIAWPAVGEPKLVLPGGDYSRGSAEFTPDSRTIYFTAEDSGLVKLYAMPAEGGAVKLAADPQAGVYGSLSLSRERDGKPPVLIATWGSSVNPPELVRIDPLTGKHRLLTSFNVEVAKTIDWQPPVHFTFTSSRGRQIHNMMVLPPAFDEKKKYPVIAMIHGGAANMWSDSISYRWDYHLLASPGYVIVLTDYSGSTGYGEEFAHSIDGDPLKGPASEINEAMDEAIRRYPFIDASRQAAGGASYGGHIANWLEATTTRYRCLFTHAGLVNTEAQWGTSDAIFHRELMAGGPVWEQNEIWREQNPIRFAANYRTPMLVTVGERDFRVPLNNALENWSALQRMKVPSKLIVFPEANHWVTRPEDSRFFWKELHAWLARWL